MVGMSRKKTRKPRKNRNKRFNVWRSRVSWYGLPLLGLVIGIWATLRFSPGSDPPGQHDNICEIFREHTVWYDYARASQEKWGTPVATQLAFVYYESSLQPRPPSRTRLWG